MAKDEKDHLLDEIDRTALDLLSKIRAEDILAEKVKAFGEVVKWAQVKGELRPKEAAGSAFAALKESFHNGDSGKAKRGRGSSKATAEAPADTPAAEPVSGAEPAASGASEIDDLY